MKFIIIVDDIIIDSFQVFIRNDKYKKFLKNINIDINYDDYDCFINKNYN